MHQRPFLGGGWARGGASEVVRRAHPASGAQWNVQVVRGKVNGKCLWNACKALSLGLLLMVLGAAMATIGYYADHLSIAQEIRGNHTVRIKNESRGFHLNNLSYAGPIVMGVGGFIVVAACVMTFEARDSAAKVVPARLKINPNGPPSGNSCEGYGHGMHSHHGSLRTSGSQTGIIQHPAFHSQHIKATVTDRRTLTESLMNFSRGLATKTQNKAQSLKISSQGSINRSPSAPDLVLDYNKNQEKSPNVSKIKRGTERPHTRSLKSSTNCALLNAGLLHRHALSVDETAVTNYRLSRESLQGSGSSLALDLHLDCPVTLRIHDRRRNPLMRQKRIEDDDRQVCEDNSRRSSHSCSPKMPLHHIHKTGSGGSAQQLPIYSGYCSSSHHKRRSSNASDSTHRSRPKIRDCPHIRGKLERAISSDSRLMGAVPRTHRHHSHSPCHGSQEHEPGESCSENDIRQSHRVVHHCSHRK